MRPSRAARCSTFSRVAKAWARNRARTIDFRYQAIIQSQDLIRAGRLAVLLFAAGTVLVTALLAARLVGRRAAVVAGIIAATMPALVTRSAIVVVDTPAAFFATACLLCVAYMRTGERPVLWASAAGAAAGFGTASKYPTGVVIFAVLTVIALWRDRPIEYRLKLAGAAVVVAGIAAIVGAPTLLFRAHTVLSELRTQSHIYASKTSIDSYWDSLRDGREVGPLLLVVSAVFAVALAGPLLRYPVSAAPQRASAPSLSVRRGGGGNRGDGRRGCEVAAHPSQCANTPHCGGDHRLMRRDGCRWWPHIRRPHHHRKQSRPDPATTS